MVFSECESLRGSLIFKMAKLWGGDLALHSGKYGMVLKFLYTIPFVSDSWLEEISPDIPK
jgi:hypothetical protein